MANWPGQIVTEDEYTQMPTFAPQEQAQPNVQAAGTPPAQPMQAAPKQFPGEVVDAAPEAQLVDTSVGGFADEAPAEAATQLTPEQTAQFYALVKDPKSTAQTLTDFMGSHGQTLQNADDIIAGRNKGIPIGDAINYALPEVGSDSAAGATARGVLDTLTFGTAPKIGAVVGGLERSLSGDGSFSDGYNRVLDNNNAATAADEKEHPWMRIAGQLLGGLAIPTGLEGVGLRAGSEVLRAGASMADARIAATIAVRNRSVAMGAGFGAAHGAGSADNLPDVATGALTEGALGAGAAAAIPLVAPVARAILKPLRSASDLVTGSMTGRTVSDNLQPFADENVPALAADVGGIFSRMASGASNMTLGGIPLAQAAKKSVAAAQDLKTRIADRIGNPFRDVEGRTDKLGAGLAAQRGVRSTLGEGGSKQAVGEGLFAAIPIAPGTIAEISNTRTALSDLTAGLSSNQALSDLVQDGRLKGYADALKDKGLSWGDLKSFRSYIGNLAGRPTLQDSTSQDDLRRLYAGLSEDMRATASKQGGDALSKFTRANNYWRGLQTRREQVLKPLLGNKMDASGESAFRQIESWSTDKGNVVALARTLRSMPEQDAANIRATVFDRLGVATKGAQNADGTAWSPATFVTHWNGLSSRAKSVLFPGSEYRQSMDNLVRIAGAQKSAQDYANVSKTGNAVNGIALLTGFFTNPLGTLPVALGQIGTGAVLGSPRFANWLASSVNKPNPAAALAHVNRLSAIARAEPAIANEVLQLQARLADAFSSAPARMAAQEPANETNGAQGNASQQQRQPQSFQP